MATILSPLPSPPIQASTVSLPIEIHAATRSLHTSLNRSITSRLPLCLPPHTSTPALYTTGISAFAEVYFAFEKGWREILGSGELEPRIKCILNELRFERLLRVSRLEHDIGLLNPGLRPRMRAGISSEELKMHCQDEFPPSDIGAFAAAKIASKIHSKPHVLMAYSWVMYMALFNGGRWIRGQLREAGPGFWDSASGTNIPCLSFWDFESESDGNDIKDEFKSTFNSAAEQLTEAERKDVVEEAAQVFRICTEIVEALDRECAQVARRELTVSKQMFLLGVLIFSYLLAFLHGLRGYGRWFRGTSRMSSGTGQRSSSGWRGPGYEMLMRKQVHAHSE